MWDDVGIDAAIDEAARELTAGDPGPEFRVRVMERIERAPKVLLPRRLVAVGVAIAAIVAIAVMVRLTPQPMNGNRPEATEVRQKPDSTEVRLKPDSPYESRPPAPKSAFGGPRKPPSVYVRSDIPSEIEPLATPPLDLESIAVPALDADASLRIDPLPSAPSIAVAPLGAEPEGDRR
jgi:hypothetical protein